MGRRDLGATAEKELITGALLMEREGSAAVYDTSDAETARVSRSRNATRRLGWGAARCLIDAGEERFECPLSLSSSAAGFIPCRVLHSRSGKAVRSSAHNCHGISFLYNTACALPNPDNYFARGH